MCEIATCTLSANEAMFSKYGRDTRNESSLQSMVCYLKYSLKRHMLLPDCALPCATQLFLFAEPSCVLPRGNFTLTFAKMLSRLTVQLFSFSSCEDLLTLQHLHAAVSELLICCCCYSVCFPVCLCRRAVLLWRQPPQSAPAVVCPGHCVQSPHNFNFGYSTPVLIRCRLDLFSTARNCFLVFLCCKTYQKKYSTTSSLKSVYR